MALKDNKLLIGLAVIAVFIVANSQFQFFGAAVPFPDGTIALGGYDENTWSVGLSCSTGSSITGSIKCVSYDRGGALGPKNIGPIVAQTTLTDLGYTDGFQQGDAIVISVATAASATGGNQACFWQPSLCYGDQSSSSFSFGGVSTSIKNQCVRNGCENHGGAYESIGNNFNRDIKIVRSPVEPTIARLYYGDYLQNTNYVYQGDITLGADLETIRIAVSGDPRFHDYKNSNTYSSINTADIAGVWIIPDAVKNDGEVCVDDTECINNDCMNSTCGGIPLLDDGDACTSDGQCSSGLCYQDVCTQPIPDGDPCTDPLLCIGGFCNNNVCSSQDVLDDGEICTENYECLNNFCNNESLCETPVFKNDGESCTDASECLSDYCNENICTPYPPNQVTISFTLDNTGDSDFIGKITNIESTNPKVNSILQTLVDQEMTIVQGETGVYDSQLVETSIIADGLYNVTVTVCAEDVELILPDVCKTSSGEIEISSGVLI